MVPKSEAELIRAVLGGNAHAYRALIEPHQDRAYALARRLVNHSEVAEELVQDAFVQAYRHLDRFRGEAAFGTWLHRIVLRTCLGYLRQQKRRPRHLALDQNDEPVPPEGLRHLEQADQATRIQAALQQLPPKERLVLQLFYLDELSVEEIRQHSGFSRSNIKVLLHRGRKKFRRLFSPDETLEKKRHEA